MDGVMLGLHLATVHVTPGSGVPERWANPGAYVQWANGLTAGAYRNSQGRLGAYAGRTFTTADGRWALTVGAVTGYTRAPVLPMVVPSVRLGERDGWGLRLSLLPKVSGAGLAGVHLSVDWRL